MLSDDLGIDNSLLDDKPSQSSSHTSFNSKRNLLEELRLKQVGDNYPTQLNIKVLNNIYRMHAERGIINKWWKKIKG